MILPWAFAFPLHFSITNPVGGIVLGSIMKHQRPHQRHVLSCLDSLSYFVLQQVLMRCQWKHHCLRTNHESSRLTSEASSDCWVTQTALRALSFDKYLGIVNEDTVTWGAKCALAYSPWCARVSRSLTLSMAQWLIQWWVNNWIWWCNGALYLMLQWCLVTFSITPVEKYIWVTSSTARDFIGRHNFPP